MKRMPSSLAGFAAALLLMTACGPTPQNDTQHNGQNTAPEAVASSTEDHRFLNLSDLHFDPFHDPALVPQLIQADYTEWAAIFEQSKDKTFSTYGADANYPLMHSSLLAMKREIPDPDFIMISGDFLAHHFERSFEQYANVSADAETKADYVGLHEFIEKTMRFIALQIDEQYPDTPVYAALGNNDSYCGDYMVQPGGKFLQMITEVWQPLLREHEANSTMATDFPKAGYYKAQSPMSEQLNFYVLNSILFSSNFNQYHEFFCEPGSYGPNNSDPGKAQLVWLRQELSACRSEGKKAWLVQHIPPGINTYPSLPKNDTCVGDTSIFFTDAFNAAYLELVREFADVIACNMAGHYHKDDFRIIHNAANTEAVSYMHILPSISPIYNNNPGFEVVDYDPETGVLNNYTVYWANVAPSAQNQDWSNEYSFQSVYKESSISTETLVAVHKRLETDVDLQKEYMLYYPVSDGSNLKQDMEVFRAYWCSINQMTKKDFADCCCSAPVSKESD